MEVLKNGSSSYVVREPVSKKASENMFVYLSSWLENSFDFVKQVIRE